MIKKVRIFSTSRADFGIYEPLINELLNQADFSVQIVLLGGHLEPEMKGALNEALNKYPESITLERTLIKTETRLDMLESMAKTCIACGKYLQNSSPFDFEILLGDRFEMFSVAQSLITSDSIKVHFHGGESTGGSLDDKFRDCISILSDLHFTSCEKYKNNVHNLTGSKNVFNSGALSLLGLDQYKRYDIDEISQFIGHKLDDRFHLVTLHPETLGEGAKKNHQNVEVFATFLKELKGSVLITGTNKDPGAETIRTTLKKLCVEMPKKFIYVESLGRDRFFSTLNYAKIMIGNSSSGIIEAASFNLPVINVGERQRGRAQSKNTVDASWSLESLHKAYSKAMEIRQPYKNVYFNSTGIDLIMNKFREIGNEK